MYPNESTKAVYKSGIFKFMESVYNKSRTNVRPTKKQIAELTKLSTEYFNTERNHAKDLMKFVISLNESPPKTAKVYFAGVKEFLLTNGVELSHRELKNLKLKLPKGNARTEEVDLENEIINQILEHMGIKGKALVLVLASSGMRIGEALQIELDDIDMESTPTPINIRGEYTKNGMQRYTFISKEAKTALLEWLKVRDSYLDSALNRNNGLVKSGKGNSKKVDDNRIFPFSYSVAGQMWNNALDKSENLSIDKSTGRKKVRIHALRKFFRSHLTVGCPLDIVEALMGHDGYLTDAYRRYNKTQIGEIYLKHEHLVYVTMPKDIHKIESEFKEDLNKNRKLIEDLVIENRELMDRVEAMEENNEKFNYILQSLVDGTQPERLVLDHDTGKLILHK